MKKKFHVELDTFHDSELIEALKRRGCKEVGGGVTTNAEPGDGDNGSDPRGNGGH